MKNAYESNRREWRPSIEDDPVSVNIENRLHVSAEIDTNPADIEDIENYEKKSETTRSKDSPIFLCQEHGNTTIPRKVGSEI